MEKRIVDGVDRSSGNVYADLGLPDAQMFRHGSRADMWVRPNGCAPSTPSRSCLRARAPIARGVCSGGRSR
jgi:hypothetical protein